MSKKVKKIIYWCLLAIFGAVFLVSAFLVGRYFVDTWRQTQQNNHLAGLHTTAPATEPTGTEPTPPDPTEDGTTDPTQPTNPPMLSEMEGIYALNQDVVGWISIEGTDINYPVLQSRYQQNFYLDKDFYKEDSVAGQIYVREACDVFAPSDNITIYGHNMANGTMFGQLHRYRKSKAFYEEHKYIQFDTLYERHTYEIISVFITSGTYGVGYPYHLFDNAANAEEFDAFIAACKGKNPELSGVLDVLYDIPVSAEYGDKLITLSTCYNYTDNGRLVILAKQIQ